MPITREQILDDVRDVIAKHGGDRSIATYRKHGRYSPTTVYSRFIDWPAVLLAVETGIVSEEAAPGGKFSRRDSSRPQNTDKKLRTCLMCDRQFMSWGPANRKCTGCRQTKTHLDGDDLEPYELHIPRDGFLATS